MCVLWGVPYLLIKVAVEGVSVPVLVFARTAIGGLLLLPFAFRNGAYGVFSVVLAHWRPLLAFTLCEMVGPWFFLSDAERTLPSSLAGLIIATVPVLAAIVTRLTGSTERLTWQRRLGLAVGLVGVAVLVWPKLSGGDAWPIAEVLLTALGYAIAPLIMARFLSSVPGLPMTAVSLTAVAVIYTPPAILTWPDRWPDAGVLAAIAALAVICTALAFLVFFALIREVGPVRAPVFTYVNPAVAVLAGVVVLGEQLSVLIVAAFGLILAGSVLATSRQVTAPETHRGGNPLETRVG